MILYGKPVADALREQYAKRIEENARKTNGKRTLTVIKDDTSDKGYLAAIQRSASRWKINVQCSDRMDGVYADKYVIDICKLPMDVCTQAVDGQNVWGRASTYAGYICEDTPCTAEAIIRMLDYYDIPIAGRHAVVIGRSERVGKPTAMLLLARDATVTVCHSKTKQNSMYDLVSNADIVVCASGQNGLLDWTCVPDGCTVINVGGDYDEWCDNRINLIPFKGGVGPVTTAVLMSHVLM